MKFIQYVLRRSNVKAVSMLMALILCISGVTMIFMGIRDSGFIDIKSVFLTGHAKSGFVGISLIFIALCISVACLFAKKSSKEVVVKCGNVELEFGGQIRSDEDMESIRSICKVLLSQNIEEVE